MEKSEQRILTTHVGSLPRNARLSELLIAQEQQGRFDAGELERETEAAVEHVVKMQLEAGIDIGNDGEQPRVGFQTYVPQRMKGFGGESHRKMMTDLSEFPDFARLMAARMGLTKGAKITNLPAAITEVVYEDLTPARKECDLFDKVTQRTSRKFTERFMTAATPGIISTTMLNSFYDTHERYVMALAEQMRREYEYIVSRGLILQLDAPDLAMERNWHFQEMSIAEFLKVVEIHVAAINQAIKNIARDRVRLHICWGNYDGPHVNDVPLELIAPIVFQAKVGAIAIEMANPRHQHEYKVLREHQPPDGTIVIPGVIDSTNNYVEHPETVADRICAVVEAIGDRTRVIAGCDCGFATFTGYEMTAESVVWAKFKALAQGAGLATKRLWGT
jgi:5-methyltetrahydropteroyltriglutamate--homocysteine methyltransferase